MTQFYSRNDVNYSGDVYSIPFDYIDKKEVKVYIDDELWTKWHFLSEHQLTLDEVPADIRYSNIISVRRETDIEEKVVTYDNNSLLNKENLNKSQDQLLFAVQEVYDNNTQFAIDIRAEVDEKVERVSDAVEKLEFLEDSVATANEAALEATEQAQIATEKAEETLNTFNEAMTEIDTLRQDSIDEVNQLVADHTDDLNALDQLIKKDADAIINRVGLNMFDTVVKDHVLTYEESRGLALQGTWVYHDAIAGERYGYPDFYNKVVEEFEQATPRNFVYTDTISWTVYDAPNGHMYIDASEKSKIDTLFEAQGMAWYYILDRANKRVFLPRNTWFEQMSMTQAGKWAAAGLPNITGEIGIGGDYGLTTNDQPDNSVGALYRGTTLGRSNAGMTGQLGSKIAINASRSSAIYGKSNTVQPNAIKKLLYICVGNQVQDTSWVDVVTQVKGGVKDIENKTQEGLNKLNTTANNSIANINTTTNNSIANINTTAKNYDNLTKRQITNCLLEVPQRIKLELADGVLTLKAGSVIIVPNGFEADGTTPKFDYVSIESDLSKTNTDNITMYAFYQNGELAFGNITVATSGATIPTTGFLYNIETNKISFYLNNALIWDNGSLPVAIVKSDSSGITSIDQIFNGMGYIGSTIWVDKGVKGLAPNGRNEDGSLNNREFTTDKVLTYTSGKYANSRYITLSATAVNIPYKSYYSYDHFNNINLVQGGRVVNAVVGTLTTDTNGVISNFQSKQPFRAVDYSQVDGQWVQSVLTISTAAGSGENTYSLADYLPKDGYNYEVLFNSWCYNNGGTYYKVGVRTDLITNIVYLTGGGGQARSGTGSATIPVGTGRTVVAKREGGLDSVTIKAIAYRRIGTNS